MDITKNRKLLTVSLLVITVLAIVQLCITVSGIIRNYKVHPYPLPNNLANGISNRLTKISGTISKIQGSKITIETAGLETPTVVVYSSATSITDSQDKKLKLSSLKVGQKVVVDVQNSELQAKSITVRQ